MGKEWVQEILAAALAVLFVYAGLSKLLDFHTFRTQMESSPLLTNFSGWLAWLVPGLEIVTAILLSFPKTRLQGFYFSLFFMLVFTGYIYSMLHFSSYRTCSCGGVISKMSWNQHLVFNIFFTGLAFAGILIQSKWKRVPTQ